MLKVFAAAVAVLLFSLPAQAGLLRYDFDGVMTDGQGDGSAVTMGLTVEDGWGGELFTAGERFVSLDETGERDMGYMRPTTGSGDAVHRFWITIGGTSLNLMWDFKGGELIPLYGRSISISMVWGLPVAQVTDWSYGVYFDTPFAGRVGSDAPRCFGVIGAWPCTVSGSWTVSQVQAAKVDEPNPAPLLVAGLVGLLYWRRRHGSVMPK